MSAEASVGGLEAVTGKVLRYFKEFISTDFKRQQAPRRRVQLKTKEVFRTAIDLRKYSSFFLDAWGLLSKGPQAMTLRIGRRTYRASISPVLKNLMEQFVRDMPTQSFGDTCASLTRPTGTLPTRRTSCCATWVMSL